MQPVGFVRRYLEERLQDEQQRGASLLASAFFASVMQPDTFKGIVYQVGLALELCAPSSPLYKVFTTCCSERLVPLQSLIVELHGTPQTMPTHAVKGKVLVVKDLARFKSQRISDIVIGISNVDGKDFGIYLEVKNDSDASRNRKNCLEYFEKMEKILRDRADTNAVVLFWSHEEFMVSADHRTKSKRAKINAFLEKTYPFFVIRIGRVDIEKCRPFLPLAKLAEGGLDGQRDVSILNDLRTSWKTHPLFGKLML